MVWHTTTFISHQYGQEFCSFQKSSIWPDILQLPAVINMKRYSTAVSSQYDRTFYSCQQSSIWPDILQLSAVINMVRYSTAARSHQYGQIFYSCQQITIQKYCSCQQSSIWSAIFQLPWQMQLQWFQSTCMLLAWHKTENCLYLAFSLCCCADAA